jgi:hypothetical protein
MDQSFSGSEIVPIAATGKKQGYDTYIYSIHMMTLIKLSAGQCYTFYTPVIKWIKLSQAQK